MGYTALHEPSRAVLKSILSQLEDYKRALHGIEVTLIDRDVAFHQGEPVIKNQRDVQWTVGREPARGDIPIELLDSLRLILTSSAHSFEEVPSSRPDELCILVTPRQAMGFAQFLETKDTKLEGMAVTLILKKAPARLLRIEVEPPGMAWPLRMLIRLAFKSLTVSAEFDYVRGVPVPVLMQSRMQSRGLGSWRVDEGNEIEFQYDE